MVTLSTNLNKKQLQKKQLPKILKILQNKILQMFNHDEHIV